MVYYDIVGVVKVFDCIFRDISSHIYEERNDYVSLIIRGFLEYKVLFFFAGLTFFIAELLLLAGTNLHLT